MTWELHHGDSMDILPTIQRAALVVTDPPYSFGLNSVAGAGKHGGWQDLMNAAYWYAEILRQLKRITEADQGAVWMFNSWRSFPVLARASTLAGWPILSLAIWDKMWIGTSGPNGLRSSYEQIALFAHPGFSIKDRSVADIFRSKWTAIKPTGHPAEKPLELVERLIEISGNTGPVLDPFAGSGTTLVAARRRGLDSIGIEGEDHWHSVATDRLCAEESGSTLGAVRAGQLALPTAEEATS